MIVDVPLWLSLVAVIVATPATTAVTSPLPFTVAAVVLLLSQASTRSEQQKVCFGNAAATARKSAAYSGRCGSSA